MFSKCLENIIKKETSVIRKDKGWLLQKMLIPTFHRQYVAAATTSAERKRNLENKEIKSDYQTRKQEPAQKDYSQILHTEANRISTAFKKMVDMRNTSKFSGKNYNIPDSAKKGLDEFGKRAKEWASEAEKEIKSLNWPLQWRKAWKSSKDQQTFVAITHAPLVLPTGYMWLTLSYSPLIGQANLLCGAVLLSMWGAARLVSNDEKKSLQLAAASTLGGWVSIILASPITDLALISGHFALASMESREKDDAWDEDFKGLRIIAAGVICVALFMNMLARWILPVRVFSQRLVHDAEKSL